MVVVAADGTRAYTTNIGSGTTTAIDLRAGRKLADVPTGKGSEALALAPDGRELWVAARSAGVVAVVDTASLEVVARIPVEGIPIRLGFTPDGRTALVTCAGAARLVAIDAASRAVRRGVAVDVPLAPGAAARPFAQLAPGSVLPIGLQVGAEGRMTYVAATMGDAVVQFETASLTPLRTIAVGGEPDGLATTPVLPRPPCHACAPQAEAGAKQ
jgi:YVTN family beta-propeller protein